MLTITLLSLGTPMILMGDEIGHSQKSNNNGYCQDNPTFWFDWSQIKKNRALFDFTNGLIKQRTAIYLNPSYRYSLHDIIQDSDIHWHGVKLNQPDWRECSHSIAMESTDPHSGVVSYVIFNAFWEILHFELPLLASGKWLRIVDTSLTDGNDIYRDGDEKHWFNGEYIVASRTVVLLIGETPCYQ